MEAAAARGGDNTRSLAIAAVEEASDAKVGVSQIKRTVARTNWMWGVFLLIGAIFGAGYIFHEWKDHFATKEMVTKHEEELQRIKEWQQQKDEHERAKDEMMTRMANQIDDIHRYFMRK